MRRSQLEQAARLQVPLQDQFCSIDCILICRRWSSRHCTGKSNQLSTRAGSKSECLGNTLQGSSRGIISALRAILPECTCKPMDHLCNIADQWHTIRWDTAQRTADSQSDRPPGRSGRHTLLCSYWENISPIIPLQFSVKSKPVEDTIKGAREKTKQLLLKEVEDILDGGLNTVIAQAILNALATTVTLAQCFRIQKWFLQD